jgi:phosphoacetylglucosamine mutase
MASNNLEILVARYPVPDVVPTYGTAGFRTDAKQLPSTAFRMGIMAALLSKSFKGLYVAVMVTASHNVWSDNGLKITDPDGAMVSEDIEKSCGLLAGARTAEELTEAIEKVSKSINASHDAVAKVIYGRESRESGPTLIKALEDGLTYAGAQTKDFGEVTTPQLHYFVKALNTEGTKNPYGVPSEDGYYTKMANAYKQLVSELGGNNAYAITVDAANGIGAPKLAALSKYLGGLVDITVVNGRCESPQMLNADCGADYVKTNQKLPAGIDAVAGKLYASFDGDADRVVFFYVDERNQFVLLDGDKIATLAAAFLQDLAREAGFPMRVGVVQTAYANGASTTYLTNVLKVQTDCTPTGVKHLHRAAHKYDIGVYFEANGHGTVLFDPAIISSLHSHKVATPAQKSAADSLLALSELINQTVGDAISDLLLVLVILTIKKWSASEWNEAYRDLPNRLLKVQVKDRSQFVTTNAERQLVKPEGVQKHIDELVSKYPSGRSFVRASGTENVVRIYAESETRDQADSLALKVSQLLDLYK